MLRKTLLALGCAAGLGFSANAQAATIVFDIAPPGGSFQTVGAVQCNVGPCIGNAGNFSLTGTFDAPAGFLDVGASITTFSLTSLNNIDFTSVTLNGATFALSPTGNFEFGDVGPIALQAINTLVVNGYTGGGGGFGGSLAFAGAIPEPATWGLMILGFGAVGAAMRRREKVSAKLNFA